MENQKLFIRGKNDLPFVCFQTVSNSQSILPQRIQIIIQIQSVYSSSKSFQTLTKIKRESVKNSELMMSSWALMKKNFFFFLLSFPIRTQKETQKRKIGIYVCNDHGDLEHVYLTCLSHDGSRLVYRWSIYHFNRWCIRGKTRYYTVYMFTLMFLVVKVVCSILNLISFCCFSLLVSSWCSFRHLVSFANLWSYRTWP